MYIRILLCEVVSQTLPDHEELKKWRADTDTVRHGPHPETRVKPNM